MPMYFFNSAEIQQVIQCQFFTDFIDGVSLNAGRSADTKGIADRHHGKGERQHENI